MLSFTTKLVGLAACGFIAVEANNPCKNPGVFNAESTVDFGDGPQPCGDFTSFVPASVPACEASSEANGGFAGVKANLYKLATACCGDKLPSEVCGPFPNPCQNPSDFTPDAVVNDADNFQCYMTFASLPLPKPAKDQDKECMSKPIPGDPITTKKKFLSNVAGKCCGANGVQAQSEICGAPPNPCKNKGKYDGNALWSDDGGDMTCDGGLISLPTKKEECTAPVEGSGNDMNKADLLRYAATRCCSDGVANEICGKAPNPCKNKDKYDGNALWNDDGGDMTCNHAIFSLPTKYNECGDRTEGSDTNKAGVLLYAASRCCTDGVADDMCEVGNPCKTPGNFVGSNEYTVDDDGRKYTCANAQSAYQFPANSGQCAANDEGEGGGLDRALHGSMKCCSGGLDDMATACGDKAACFKTFYKCLLTDGQSSAITAAEAKLVTDNVKAALEQDEGVTKGDCGTALANKVAGETCCTPFEKFAKCVGDLKSCPDLAGPPVNIVPAVVDSVIDAFKAGGYCVSKPWAMTDKAAKKKWTEDALAAAKEKKAKCGTDAACTQAAQAEITALETEVQTIAGGETTTTAAADNSAAFALGPAPVAALAAFSMAAVAAAVL